MELEVSRLAEEKAYLEQLEVFLALQEEEIKLAELMAGLVVDAPLNDTVAAGHLVAVLRMPCI